MYDKHTQNTAFGAGVTNSVGLNSNADVLRRMVNIKSETMLEGTAATVMMPVEVLDVRFDIPNTTSFTPDKIAEGTKGSLKALDTFKVTSSLDKYSNVFTITHETVARGIADTQTTMSLNAAAKGLALQRNTNVFSALTTGIGDTIAAADVWSDTNGLADPASDIANAIGSIGENTFLTPEEMSDITVFYPMSENAHLLKPMDVNGIVRTFADWAQGAYGVTLIPTRNLTTNALVVARSEQNAIHMDYTGNDVPLSFVTEDSAGVTYEIMNYFKTVVLPDTDGGTTNNSIISITGVGTA